MWLSEGVVRGSDQFRNFSPTLSVGLALSRVGFDTQAWDFADSFRE